MHEMTKQNLESAFAGESQAHMRYAIFAEKAEKEGRKNLARLFQAISYAERVHATNHYRELGQIKDAAGNLQTCIDGENYEVDDMYPAFHAVAELQGEKGAARSTHYALEAEKIHAKMYADAKKTVETKQDIDLGKMHICPVCGHTVEGEAPDVCPICGARGDSFKAF
jgi:rubrerythrin